MKETYLQCFQVILKRSGQNDLKTLKTYFLGMMKCIVLSLKYSKLHTSVFPVVKGLNKHGVNVTSPVNYSISLLLLLNQINILIRIIIC